MLQKVFLYTLASFVLPLSTANAAEQTDLGLYFSEETLVETVTRHPKPFVKVAENIAIVTAAQIKKMNAHTLYEVLQRVPGLFVTFNGADFGSSASLTVHGSSSSDLHRVTALLDGLRLNSASSGTTFLSRIPVEIIERIEIIKGPGSSTWGSSIGGVINIITKSPAIKKTHGKISGSYGEGNSSDVRGELEGQLYNQDYYLFLGNQNSDGLSQGRFFENTHGFTKALFHPSSKTTVALSGGYSQLEQKFAEYSLADSGYFRDDQFGFTSLGVDATLSDSLIFHLGAGFVTEDGTNSTKVLGTGIYGRKGDPFIDQSWKEQRMSLDTRLVKFFPNQTLVMGAEAEFSALDYELDLAPAAMAAYGLGTHTSSDSDWRKSYAVYLNDTLSLDALTITPGLRYDYNNMSGDFVSPSLGATYQFSDKSRLLGTASRGFSAPYISQLQEIAPIYAANPDLKPEKVWSVQAGAETKSIPYLLVKSMLFYHDIDQVWTHDSANNLVNGGSSRRKGIELEMETIPWNSLSLSSSLSYTKVDPDDIATDNFYKINVNLAYRNPTIVNLELFGIYMKMLDSSMSDGEDNTIIWDLCGSRKFSIGESISAELFFTIHNLTNEKQYWSNIYQNPERWVEAGLRFSF